MYTLIIVLIYLLGYAVCCFIGELKHDKQRCPGCGTYTRGMCTKEEWAITTGLLWPFWISYIIIAGSIIGPFYLIYHASIWVGKKIKDKK